MGKEQIKQNGILFLFHVNIGNQGAYYPVAPSPSTGLMSKFELLQLQPSSLHPSQQEEGKEGHVPSL